MTGKIVKGIAGFYYVAAGESGIYECKAKGIFRLEKIKPLVGDEVELTLLDEENKLANIDRILPRKNELYRPAAANVDQALIIFALANPIPNLQVLDRFLIQMERSEIPVIIAFNKSDLAEKDKAEHLLAVYADAGYRTVLFSAKNGSVEEIRDLLSHKTTVLAGPSGVGKSTTVNAVFGRELMETGEISKKLRKGKHTTRHSELFMLGPDTFLFDTPGFTSFETAQMEKEDLKDCFPELVPFEGRCRFLGCVHVDEPDCEVKKALKNGLIHIERYNSYVQLFKELKEAEKNRY